MSEYYLVVEWGSKLSQLLVSLLVPGSPTLAEFGFLSLGNYTMGEILYRILQDFTREKTLLIQKLDFFMLAQTKST